jgi:hypothetical protein
MGTVVKVSTDTIDVKTTKGETKQVMISEKTKFTKEGNAIKPADIKEGDRVVIEAHPMKDMGGMLQAESVRVGSAKKATEAKAKEHSH